MTWAILGASHIGPAHAENQDYVDYRVTPEYCLLALADGAGSALNSAEGAHQACASALEAGETALRGGCSASEAVELALASAISALGTDSTKACTLSLVVATALELVTLNVGDSPIFVVHTSGIDHLEAPRQSEFVNETSFVTSKDPAPFRHSYDPSQIQAVVLSSDGLTPIVTSPAGPHPGFFTPLLDRARTATLDLEGLLAHMSAQQLLGDDTSILVAIQD